jgi:diacylglycerol kinase (ATP)
MSTSCVLFWNKHAGALKATPGLETIEKYIKEIGLECEIRYPDSAKDMAKQIAILVKEGAEKIIVSGGDGTVRLAAQQMAHSDTVLGILPMGTANNFATSLHLPMELAEAIRTVKDGVVTEVSLGRINNSYFTEAAGVGIFADALALYGAGTNKNVFKGLRSVFKVVFSLPRSRIKVTLDDKVVVERAAMCTVSNTFRIANSMPMAPDASLTDDVLDVTLIGDIHRRELLSYYRAIRTQMHGSLPKVQIEKAKVIKIESLMGINVHADDRIIGTTPVTIYIEEKALKVLTPRV